MKDAFYIPSGEHFEPTGFVRGPWSFDHCHAGPPAALLTDRICSLRPEMAMTRFTADIPGPIPIQPVRVETEVLRPGRKITHIGASLVGLDGTTYMSGAGWLMRIDESVLPMMGRQTEPPPPPEECESIDMVFWDGEQEIFGAMEVRSARGAPFRGQGQATAWLRPKVTLIKGEPTRPEALAATVSDFQNGISTPEPLNRLLCVNTDVSFYLGRRPVRDWIALDAATNSSGLGLGMTDSLLYDASGLVGTANQSIFFDSLSAGNPGTGSERLTDESS